MKLVILGSGTCASQLPNIPNRFPPGFLLEWGTETKKRILFDCSEGMRFRLEHMGYDYAAIEHIAITHPHPDHYAFVHFYQSAYCNNIWGKKQVKQVHVYAPDYIVENFPALWKLYTPELKGQFFDLNKIIFHPMSSGEEVCTIGDATLSAQPVYHAFGEADSVAFRIETPEGIFAYSGDTGECPGIRAVAKEADIFVCEASARIGDEAAATTYGHLTPYLAGVIAKEARVKKLILVHYTGLDSDEGLEKDARRSGFTGELVVGKDFTEHKI